MLEAKLIGAKRKRIQREKANELQTGSENNGTELEIYTGTSSETNNKIDGKILGHCPIDIEKELDIEIDEEIDEEIDDERRKLKEENLKIQIQEKLKIQDESEINECLAYLKIMEADVIINALNVTKQARKPCWNYAKKVLETYKTKKIFTMNLLLDYEKKKSEQEFLPKNIPKKQFAFAEDYHTKEEWDELYDN